MMLTTGSRLSTGCWTAGNQQDHCTTAAVMQSGHSADHCLRLPRAVALQGCWAIRAFCDSPRTPVTPCMGAHSDDPQRSGACDRGDADDMHGLLVHALQPATEPMQAAATCRGTRPCLVDCNMSASSNPRIVRVSKEMSKVLRHQPPEGAMDPQGWVDVPVLLGVLRSKPTYEELVAVVEENDKKRFVLDTESVPPRIRAAQGHSVHLEEPVLTPVSSSNQVPYAIHVTSNEGWEGIQASGELRRMGRTHIHFATLPSHVRRNKWATVYLQLLLEDALQAGHPFATSTNGVLLTPGPLPVRFVRLVSPDDMPPDWWAVLGEPPAASS